MDLPTERVGACQNSPQTKTEKRKKKKKKKKNVDALQSLERNVFAALQLNQVLLAVNDRERSVLPSRGSKNRVVSLQRPAPVMITKKKKSVTSFHCPISPVKNLFMSFRRARLASQSARERVLKVR